MLRRGVSLPNAESVTEVGNNVALRGNYWSVDRLGFKNETPSVNECATDGQDLSKHYLVEKFFRGYLVHCNQVNYSLLLKLVVNLSSNWWSIVSELWKVEKSFTVNEYKNANSCIQDSEPNGGRYLGTSLLRRIQVVLFCLVKLKPNSAVTVMEKCSSSSYLDKLSQHFMTVTNSLIPSDSTAPLDDSVILTALTLLRVLAAFRGFVNYNFPPELSQRLLILLTHRTVVSERAILFHTNQPGPITELISTLLGLRIPSLGRTINSWRKLFLHTVFTESVSSILLQLLFS
ncbi:unnamed protein product [Trichobilharzia regenti]|nr:unnamed protein product [Trichobilharzia regenti]